MRAFDTCGSCSVHRHGRCLVRTSIHRLLLRCCFYQPSIVLTCSQTQGDANYDILLLSGRSKPHKNSTGGDAADNHDATHEPEKEVCGLLESELSPLQPFELDGSIGDDCTPSGLAVEELSARAEALKDRGNTLFKLGDTDAAAEVFESVLRALEPTPRVGTFTPTNVINLDHAGCCCRK